MLLALALYASTADLGLLYHDGKAHRPDKGLLLRLPPSPRRGAHSPGTSAREREDRGRWAAGSVGAGDFTIGLAPGVDNLIAVEPSRPMRSEIRRPLSCNMLN